MTGVGGGGLGSQGRLWMQRQRSIAAPTHLNNFFLTQNEGSEGEKLDFPSLPARHHEE